MFNISVERTINKPIEQVFAILSDHANYAQFKGIDKASLLFEGATVKNGVGAVREIVTGRSTLHEQIIAFESPQENSPDNNPKTALIGYRIVRSKPLRYDHQLGEVRLTEIEGKTHVHWVSKGRIKSTILGPFYFDWRIQMYGTRAFGSILKYIEKL